MPTQTESLLDELPHILLDFRQMSAFVKEPLVMARAEGVRYWDIDGKEYLDGISGIFVANLGHGNPRIIEAITRQLATLTFAPPMHGTSAPALELVRLLREITPGDLKTVKLLSGGSEAIEAALKFTLQYHRQTGHPRKYKFISRYKGYHGATLGALGATGLAARRGLYEPLLPNFIRVTRRTATAARSKSNTRTATFSAPARSRKPSRWRVPIRSPASSLNPSPILVASSPRPTPTSQSCARSATVTASC